LPKLFYDDEYDALAQMVANSGRTVKEIASFLRPDLKPESAYAWFKVCMNPTGDQRLRFGQFIAVMRFCGQFDPLFYACDELGHERPKAVTREDELTALLREYLEAKRVQERVEPRIEKLRLAQS
jgi:hypothetical protein